MLNISGKTNLSSEEIISKLKNFFGIEGLNLELTDEESNCLTYSGGGGYVTATICSDEEKNRVDLVTQEWEYQAKQFISMLK